MSKKKPSGEKVKSGSVAGKSKNYHRKLKRNHYRPDTKLVTELERASNTRSQRIDKVLKNFGHKPDDFKTLLERNERFHYYMSLPKVDA